MAVFFYIFKFPLLQTPLWQNLPTKQGSVLGVTLAVMVLHPGLVLIIGMRMPCCLERVHFGLSERESVCVSDYFFVIFIILGLLSFLVYNDGFKNLKKHKQS